MASTTIDTLTTTLRILLILCALAVVSLLYLPLPLMSQIEQAHGVSATGVISSFSLSYAFGFLLFGPLSDRIGRRAVLVGGLLALTVITLLLLAAHTPGLFITGRAAQGFVAASFPPVAIAYLAEHGNTRQRSWNVAWMSTAFLSAGLLGQIYGVLTAPYWDITTAFLPLCGVYLLTAWHLWKTPADKVDKHALSGFWSAYRSTNRLLADTRLRRVYAPALSLLCCFVTFYMALDMRLGTYLAEQGLSALLIRALAAPAFLTPLAVALALPRFGAQPVLRTGLACATTGLLFCALIGDTHIGLLLASNFLFVAGIGITVPGLIARVAEVSLPSQRGMALSLYTFILFIGASLGPWLAQHTAALSLSQTYLLLATLLGACSLYAASRVNT